MDRGCGRLREGSPRLGILPLGALQVDAIYQESHLATRAYGVRAYRERMEKNLCVLC